MSKKKHSSSGIIYSILNSRVVVLASNLIFQGIRYMARGEAIYKVSVTLILSLLIWSFSHIGYVYSILIAHLINYIFNGQFFVVYRYLLDNRKLKQSDMEEFIQLFPKNSGTYIKDVLVIGSFCRGRMRGSSDLDIRLFHKPGLFNSLRAYMYASYLRCRGMFMRFPIDIYCFSDISFMDKISDKEVPVHFFGDSLVIEKYPDSKSYGEALSALHFE